MIKIYGMPTCPYCDYIHEQVKGREDEFEYINIQKSEATRFTVDKKTGKVLPAFTAINGLGASVAEQIVKARQTGGEFTSIEDLKIRARVGDKMIDSLKKVHALDGLPEEDQISLF